MFSHKLFILRIVQETRPAFAKKKKDMLGGKNIEN